MDECPAKRDWSEDHRRSRKRVNLRFTDDQHNQMITRAEGLRLTLTAYIRQEALKLPPTRQSRLLKADEVALRLIIGHLGKLGSNANQIARGINVLARHGSPSRDELIRAATEANRALQLIQQELVETKQRILEAIG